MRRGKNERGGADSELAGWTVPPPRGPAPSRTKAPRPGAGRQQLDLITEAAASARHGFPQRRSRRNPLELISDEEINLLTGQIYGIQITIDPFSTQLIKTSRV